MGPTLSFINEEHVKQYSHVPPPASLDELKAIMEIPTFQDDPHVRGGVILDPRWLKANLSVEWFPIIGQRYVNRLLVVPLHAALSEIASGPYFDYIKPKQCGIFAPRRIYWKPGNPLSTHALAMAIDINWEENPPGTKKTSIRKQPYIIETFKKYGFDWGGDWKKADDQHFQYMKSLIRLPS